MIKLQWVSSRNVERRTSPQNNELYVLHVHKKNNTRRCKKKIVIDNGNIIIYKMLYILVGMLLTVYLEIELPSQSRFQLQLYQFLLPFVLHQSYYIQRVGRTTESNNWFNCIVVSLIYCCLTIFLTIPGVKKGQRRFAAL